MKQNINLSINKLQISDSLMIYGTGMIGKAVYMKLCLLGLKLNVEGFIVSQKDNEEYCMGIRIYSIDELCEEPMIIIAVTNKNLSGIMENLKAKKYSRYIYANEILDNECKYVIEGYELQQKEIEYCESEEKKEGNGKTAAHITYPMQGNAGDTMLSKCVRRLFDRETAIKNWDLYNVSTAVSDKIIDEINHKDVLIIGGGGLLLPDTNKNDISGWQWAISDKQIEKIKIPIIIYAIGYNYFKGQARTRLFEENIKILIDKAKFIGMRNNGSVNVIKEMLPDRLKDKIVYQPCPTTVINKIFDIPPKKSQKKIAVNVAFDRLEKRFESHNILLILDEIAQAIKEISIWGYKIILVLHCNSDSIFSLFLNHRNIDYEIVNLSYSLPNEIIQFYNETELTIGMRGHSQMIPFGVNGRILSLVTHQKMKWFLEDIDAEDWCVNVSDDLGNIKNAILQKFMTINIIASQSVDDKIISQKEKLWEITLKNNRVLNDIIK